MKASYRGYEINVTREKCMGGWGLLYYSIHRESDGYECVCSFEDSDEKVRDMVMHMKKLIDEEFEGPNPFSGDE